MTEKAICGKCFGKARGFHFLPRKRSDCKKDDKIIYTLAYGTYEYEPILFADRRVEIEYRVTI